MPKRKQPFVVEIEAKLTVMAFDDESARKKVEKAFAEGRAIGPDVEGVGTIWTYAVVPGDGDDGTG